MSDLLAIQPSTSALIVEGSGVNVLVADAAGSRVEVIEQQPILGSETRVIELLTAHRQDLFVILEGKGGARGAEGPAGPQGPAELYDSAIPPLSPPFPYLRFERDGGGDVQEIVLGTST